MKKSDYYDSAIERIERERSDLEKRVRKLERFNSYLKGIVAVLCVIGALFSKVIRDFLSQIFS